MRELGLIGLAFVPASLAQATLSVDLLTPGDPGFGHPPGMACVDIFVDVADTDHWAAGGLRGMAWNGATLLYARNDDPGTPELEQVLNPGTDHRFTTFVSKPRVRDGNGRYTNGGVGQNILRLSGATEWTTSPNIGIANDNIWTLSNVSRYTGREGPATATDSHLLK